MKIYSISLVIREMQIEILIRSHFSLTRIVKVETKPKTKLRMACAGNNVEHLKLAFLLKYKAYSHFGKRCGSFF